MKIPNEPSRSAMFWLSDVESCVDYARIAASEYDHQDEIQFLRDLAESLDSLAESLHAERVEADEVDA